MAAITYDFQILGPVTGGVPQSTSGTSVKDSAVVSGGAATISPGDLCVYANGYWAKSADGGAATDGKYGIAQSTSTDTASADGLVKVAYHSGGLLAKALVTTSANLAQGVLGDLVTIDVASGVQKVDENDATGVLNIIDYDSTAGTATVVVPWGLEVA